MSYIHLSQRTAFLAGALLALQVSTPAMAEHGCQSGSSANFPATNLLSSVNCQAGAQGQFATAVGYVAEAHGIDSVAFGHFASAFGDHATSIGGYAGAGNAVAGATAVGAHIGFLVGLGVYATAIGAGNPYYNAPSALGAYSIAIGGSNDINNKGAAANGYRSIAIGQKSVSADFGTSVGFNTTTAFAATAIGTDAQASASSSSAFGRFANASAASSLALGVAAYANKVGSVAIGNGSVANVANTVSVGTFTNRRRIVNVAFALAGSDAATLAQVRAIAAAAAETANGDLQRDVAELRALVKQQQATLHQQQQELAALKSRQATTALQE